MAIANQGYRRDLDLLETPNDFTAIDNLGGVGISFDLQIIQNNLRNISTAGFSTLTDGFFDFGTTSNFVFTNDDPIKFNTSVSFGATTFNFYVSILGIILLTIGFILPLGFEMHLPLTKIGYFAIFANGIFYIASWVLFFKGATIIGATRSSMLSSVEPLFAALLAIILLKQLLSVTEWIGFFIVLTAIYTFERNNTKLEVRSK